MSAEAVVLMLVAMAILWGGLVVAIIRLNRHELPHLDEIHRDIEQYMVNLVRNALEAMPRGGTLNVRTAARGGTVSIEVADDGPGITEEQRTRLFVPYFTTKKGGTGLGLAIVQGIVSDHGGRVEVQSAPGAGTTFTLILPAGRGGERLT